MNQDRQAFGADAGFSLNFQSSQDGQRKKAEEFGHGFLSKKTISTDGHLTERSNKLRRERKVVRENERAKGLEYERAYGVSS